MVSRGLFQFLSKIPGQNRKNLFVLLENDTRLIGLDGLYDDPNEQLSLQGQDIKIEMLPTKYQTLSDVLSQHVFMNILFKYGARGFITNGLGPGVCVNAGQCEALLSVSKTLEPSHTTLPVSRSYYEVLIRKPEPVNSPLYFLEEFTGTVWLTTLCTLVLLSVMMWALVWCLNRFVAHAPAVTFADAVTENISAFSGQGFTIDSKSVTYRVFIFVALMWNLMMSISYSTNLVSYLCAQRVPMHYNGLIDILESREYSVCLYQLTLVNIQTALKMDDEQFKVYSKWINPPKCRKYAGQLKSLMCKDKIAVVVDADNGRAIYNVHVPNCTVIALKEKYMETQNRIYIRSRSRYREQFNNVILRMQETGILKKFNQIVFGSNGVKEEDRALTSVEQSHTSYIFIGYGIGVALAIFVFVIEILVHRLTISYLGRSM